MTDELMHALDHCLRALEAGESVDSILKRYPALADDLRPLLAAARAARALGEGREAPRRAQMSSRARFLAHAAELRPATHPAPGRGFALRPRALPTALAIVVGLFLGTYGVVAASAQSLPGDQLYGLKRAAENAQILLAPTQVRPQLQEQFASNRVQEVEAVATQGRTVAVEFEGQLQSVTNNHWVITGITVVVTDGTHVTGAPAVGAVAEVKGDSQTDGTVLAAEIEIKEPGVTATPTISAATLTPVTSQTPAATATPALTEHATEVETEVRRATKTPEPSKTPEASKTPELVEGMHTPSPSEVPKLEESKTPEATDDHPEGGGGPTPSSTPLP